MADIVFNIAKGAVAEKVADSAANLGILLLKTVESDALMKDRDTITAVLSGSTEANFTNYARITGITGTVTVDDTNDRVDVSCPSPQSWASAGGAVNNTLAKLIVYYDEGATDATRIPLVALDCVITTTGAELVVAFDAAGFFRAA